MIEVFDLFEKDKEDYNKDDFCRQNPLFFRELVSGAHFIVALEQTNITLSGTGKIDGNRQSFYGDKTEPDCEVHQGKFSSEELKQIWRPAQMLFITECKNVKIQDFISSLPPTSRNRCAGQYYEWHLSNSPVPSMSCLMYTS